MLARRLISPLVAALALAAGEAACGSRTNLGCTTQLRFTREAPNLYFVLDRSTSMKQGDKWDAVRTAVASLVGTLAQDTRVGATVFPPPGATDGCTSGSEVLPLTPAPAAASAFLDATADPPSGGTPTADTLDNVRATLAAEAGHTFVVLATDGGPNCNESLTCDLASCTANIDHVNAQCIAGVPPNCCDPTSIAGPADCLDDARSVTAVRAMFDAGLPVYVIGVPGSAPYAALLDELAQAGGTARAASPGYYAVDSASEGALAGALDAVVRRVSASCLLHVDDQVSNPDGLTVTVGGAAVGAGGSDGFTYDEAHGILTLHGAACDAAQAGGAVVIDDLDECRR